MVWMPPTLVPILDSLHCTQLSLNAKMLSPIGRDTKTRLHLTILVASESNPKRVQATKDDLSILP